MKPIKVTNEKAQVILRMHQSIHLRKNPYEEVNVFRIRTHPWRFIHEELIVTLMKILPLLSNEKSIVLILLYYLHFVIKLREEKERREKKKLKKK